jgi:hypothetical protein
VRVAAGFDGIEEQLAFRISPASNFFWFTCRMGPVWGNSETEPNR